MLASPDSYYTHNNNQQDCEFFIDANKEFYAKESAKRAQLATKRLKKNMGASQARDQDEIVLQHSKVNQKLIDSLIKGGVSRAEVMKTGGLYKTTLKPTTREEVKEETKMIKFDTNEAKKIKPAAITLKPALKKELPKMEPAAKGQKKEEKAPLPEKARQAEKVPERKEAREFVKAKRTTIVGGKTNVNPEKKMAHS